MRLAGRIKMGYYPTPLTTVNRIESFIDVSKDKKASILDPCCGEGLAVQNLSSNLNAETYGIELDGCRAEEAKDNLNHVLKCSYTQSRISNGCFSLLYLNPPYDEETLNDGDVTKSERKEKVFLRDCIRYLRPKGLLVYIIPETRLDKSIVKILTYRFDKLKVFRFQEEEYKAFKQIVVFGIKKKDPEANKHIQERINSGRLAGFPEIPFAKEPTYTLPPSGKVSIFKSTVIDLVDLEKEVSKSPLWKKMAEITGFNESVNERPPLPLHQGHIALMLSNGNLDGVVGEGVNRHVVKGRVQKLVVRHQEQTQSGFEERELDQYQVSIKVLLTDGTIKHLV